MVFISDDPAGASRFRRRRFLALIAVVVTAGVTVATRIDPTSYAGDTLWAAAVYLGWGTIAPGLSRKTLIALAGFTAFTVELGQLYHTSRLDAIRKSLVGRLTLGSDFDPVDLLCYAAGIVLISVLDSKRLAADLQAQLVDSANASDRASDR